MLGRRFSSGVGRIYILGRLAHNIAKLPSKSKPNNKINMDTQARIYREHKSELSNPKREEAKSMTTPALRKE
jgi:hypothetical protein